MKIQDILLSLGKTGCLLLCYAKLADIPVEDLINNFNELCDYKAIGEDCYVLDANKLMKFFNKPYTIKKTDISNVLDNQLYIASYENGNNNHFVVCKNKEVFYNTLEKSYCVEYGVPNKIVRVLCSL